MLHQALNQHNTLSGAIVNLCNQAPILTAVINLPPEKTPLFGERGTVDISYRFRRLLRSDSALFQS